jgi:nanoRNase/pAp phosphatase (c-di-AMP/oligoRNAs hydrolase)
MNHGPQTTEIQQNTDLKFVNLVSNAKKIAIVPSKIAGIDAFSAACGLFKTLKSIEKSVYFIYTSKIPEACNDLISSDELTSDVFERELLVSIDYSETPAAKVHYSTEDDVLYLKVKPIDKNFNLSRVSAEIKGFDFDLVQIYNELQSDFDRATIVNIDNTELNTRYGSLNIIDPLAEGLSLLMLKKFTEWGFNVSKQVAKAFLTGISHRDAN